MDEKFILAEKLASLRAEKGVTQDAVGEALGVSGKTLSKWENGASSPELELIPALADYYGVEIAALFGRAETIHSAAEIIRAEYDGLACPDAVLKSQRLACDVIRGCMSRFFAAEGAVGKKAVPPLMFSPMRRTVISNNIGYELLVSSEDVNLTLMLLPNQSDFAWVTTRAGEYLPLLSFLSDPDAVKLVALFHDRNFPVNFTADYAAERAGLTLERTLSLLAQAEKLKLAGHVSADLAEGATDIYESYGKGLVLSLLTVAYEYMCGADMNECACHGMVKLIGGESR